MEAEMTTLVEVLERLRQKKIDNEFRMENGSFTAGKGKAYSPEELSIIKTFRFEGESNPDDSAILYLIKANDGMIGYSLDSYGVYSNHQDEEGYDNFIRRMKIENGNEEEQLDFQL